MNLTPDELARMMRHAQADAHRNAAQVVREMAAGYVGTELDRLQQVISMHEVAARTLDNLPPTMVPKGMEII